MGSRMFLKLRIRTTAIWRMCTSLMDVQEEKTARLSLHALLDRKIYRISISKNLLEHYILRIMSDSKAIPGFPRFCDSPFPLRAHTSI